MHQSLLKKRNNIHLYINLFGLAMYLAYPFIAGWNFFYVTLAGILLSNIVISGYYHRSLTHRSWVAPTWLQYVFLTIGAGFFMLPALGWSAIHRKHHKYSDTDQDPHGPGKGVLKNFLVANLDPELRYMRPDIRNKLLQWQVKYYYQIGIITAIITSLLFSVYTYFALVGYIYLSVVIVNLLGHNEKFHNSHILSAIFAGEMYHKNHHNNPNKEKMGLFDLPYWTVIRWLK